MYQLCQRLMTRYLKNIIKSIAIASAMVLVVATNSQPSMAQETPTCSIAAAVVGVSASDNYRVAVSVNISGLDPTAQYAIRTNSNQYSSPGYDVGQLTRTFTTSGTTASLTGTTDYVYIVAADDVTGTRFCESGQFTYSDDFQPFPEEPPLFPGQIRNTKDLCRQAGDLEDDCLTCADGEIWTALGCIPTSADGIVQSLFRIGLGIAGGAALLFILFGAFTISVSTGDPESVQKGRDMVTSAIIGLLFIIFSTVILQWIGVSILAIPGF